MIFGTISMPIFTVWPSLFHQDNSGIKLLRALHQVVAEIRNGQSRALALSEHIHQAVWDSVRKIPA